MLFCKQKDIPHLEANSIPSIGGLLLGGCRRESYPEPMQPNAQPIPSPTATDVRGGCDEFRDLDLDEPFISSWTSYLAPLSM
jgi:hypothetical protein